MGLKALTERRRKPVSASTQFTPEDASSPSREEMVTPLRRSSRHEHTAESPMRDRSRRKAAQGAFYTQYFAEGELSEVREQRVG